MIASAYAIILFRENSLHYKHYVRTWWNEVRQSIHTDIVAPKADS